jgi:hypothetical protein
MLNNYNKIYNDVVTKIAELHNATIELRKKLTKKSAQEARQITVDLHDLLVELRKENMSVQRSILAEYKAGKSAYKEQARLRKEAVKEQRRLKKEKKCQLKKN